VHNLQYHLFSVRVLTALRVQRLRYERDDLEIGDCFQVSVRDSFVFPVYVLDVGPNQSPIGTVSSTAKRLRL